MKKQDKFDKIDKLIDEKMKEETLFHKMYLEISLNKNDGNTVTAMACERVAIQAQIDLLKKQNIRISKQKKAVNQIDFFDENKNGKIDAFNFVMSNNRQEIKELEKQLE